MNGATPLEEDPCASIDLVPMRLSSLGDAMARVADLSSDT